MSAEELAESIRWEAEQYVPFDINDVNLDYVVLDAGGRRDDGRPARRRQEGQDRRLHERHHPGGQDAGARGRRRLRPPERLRGELPGRARAASSRSSTSAPRSRTSTSSPGANTIFWRDISFGGNQYTDAIQKQLSLVVRAGRGPQEGRGGGRAARSRTSCRSSGRSPTTSRRSSRRPSTSSSRRPRRRRSTSSSSPAAPRASSTSTPS